MPRRDEPDGWLEEAKRLPVGYSKRMQHGRENRLNLQISNLADKWMWWCFACCTGGQVKKEHLRIKTEQADLKPIQINEEDMLYAKSQRTEWEQIVRFLYSKNMAPEYVPSIWLHKEHRHRLFIKDNFLQWHSRAYTGIKPWTPKWLRHGGIPISGHAGPITVICEDLFSMLKLQRALQGEESASVLCTLGCSINNEAVLLMLKSCTQEVVWAYDGDSAGWHGTDRGIKRMRPHVAVQSKLNTPRGKDPKDLHILELQQLFNNRETVGE